MRNESELIERLEVESINLDSCCIYYECVGDFYRGWVAALQWALDKPESTQLSIQDGRANGCEILMCSDYFGGKCRLDGLCKYQPSAAEKIASHQDCYYFGGCGCNNTRLGVKPRIA